MTGCVFFLDYGWNILGPRRMLCSLSVSHFIKMSAGFWRDLIILQVLCFLQSTRWMSKGKIYPKSPNTYMSHYDDTVVRSWDAVSEPNRSLLQTVLIQFWIFLCTVYQHWTVFLKDTCLKMSVNADVCEFEISREPMSESLYTETGSQMIVFFKEWARFQTCSSFVLVPVSGWAGELDAFSLWFGFFTRRNETNRNVARRSNEPET